MVQIQAFPILWTLQWQPSPSLSHGSCPSSQSHLRPCDRLDCDNFTGPSSSLHQHYFQIWSFSQVRFSFQSWFSSHLLFLSLLFALSLLLVCLSHRLGIQGLLQQWIAVSPAPHLGFTGDMGAFISTWLLSGGDSFLTS